MTKPQAKKSGAQTVPASRSARTAERRARVEEERRQQQARERRRNWLVIAAVAVLIVALGVGVAITVSDHHSSSPTATSGPQIVPSTPTGTTTVQQTPTRVANTSGIKGVLAWDTQGWPGDGTSHPGALQHDHVTGPVTYAVTPPVGGPHNAIWMNAGVYTKPVPNERAVHNLEHGAVWITYRPNLPASEVSQLVAFVGKQSMVDEGNGQGNRYMDLSPWSSNALPAPIVLSSWGYQLRVTSPTDPRMQQFVDMFRHSSKFSPEFGSAVDGIPVQTGGQPAEDGSKQPNPAGTAQ